RLVAAVRDVVPVLDHDDRGDRLRLGHLGGVDDGQPQVLDLALLAQLGERAERLGERAGDGRVAVGTATEAQVHDVERLDPEGPQVRLDLGAQLLGRARVRAADRKSTRLSSSHVKISYAV